MKTCGADPNQPKKDIPDSFPPSTGNVRSDVLGSYTGTPADGDTLVQDADDL